MLAGGIGVLKVRALLAWVKGAEVCGFGWGVGLQEEPLVLIELLVVVVPLGVELRVLVYVLQV